VPGGIVYDRYYPPLEGDDLIAVLRHLVNEAFVHLGMPKYVALGPEDLERLEMAYGATGSGWYVTHQFKMLFKGIPVEPHPLFGGTYVVAVYDEG